jgi:trehalose 6-phosphate phosphatase
MEIKNTISAYIFDMDGVITKTARVHAQAWKEMFDEFIKEQTPENEDYEPFGKQSDYLKYVDGKPRYDGVRSFLESRGIELPYGTSEDPPGKKTICGLGNRKNEMFHKVIRENRVEIFPENIQFIKDLRQKNIPTAVISASKNCQEVLQAAGVEDLFDVRVDGIISAELGLQGKPHPDIFLEAARRLRKKPAECAVIEDSQAGVAAGKKGAFGWVIGINTGGQREELENSGADIVVETLNEVTPGEKETISGRALTELPSALEEFGRIEQQIEANLPVFYLDYDGTLTPIVRRPELAVLAPDMEVLLRRLGDLTPTAVVSGRDLQDVKKLVGIKEITYAGSHGFDISGPGISYQHGKEFKPDLDQAETELKPKIEAVPGAFIERKGFSIAIHYRESDESDIPKVQRAVENIASTHERLRMSSGKKIFELHPDIDWNKGKALLWLLKKMELDLPDTLAFYIGDDTTDEDAFRVLQEEGIPIVVGEDSRKSRAHYRLNNTEEVKLFFQKVIELLERKQA